MFGKLLAALYASLTRAMPRTAARARVRTKPVIRLTVLASATCPPIFAKLPPVSAERSDLRSDSPTLSTISPECHIADVRRSGRKRKGAPPPRGGAAGRHDPKPRVVSPHPPAPWVRGALAKGTIRRILLQPTAA